MTATTTRILHAVPDAPTKSVETVKAPVRQAEITEARKAAHTALTIPDVEQDLLDAVAATTEALRQPGADRNTLLIDLARRMYLHGHMDGAADRNTAKQRLKIEQGVSGKVARIEKREREQLPAKERELRVVKNP